jgi:hypothetical protein
MASKAARTQIMDGSDEGDEDAADDRTIQAALTPPAEPALRMPRTQKQEDDLAYTAIEVDEEGRQLGAVDAEEGEEVDEGEEDAHRGRAKDEEHSLAEDEGQEQQDGDGKRWPSPRDKRRRRKEARDRNIAENENLKREIATLRSQMNNFQGRVEPKLTEIDESRVRGQIAQIDGQLQAAEDKFSKAESDVVKALREGDEDAILKAMRSRDEAFIGRERLKSQKDQLARAVGEDGAEARTDGTRRPDPSATPKRRIDPGMARHVGEFRREFPWFDGDNLDDEDSQLVKHLDNRVRQAGFDPRTPDYWDELKERMQKSKSLAHRFEEEREAEDDDERQPQARRQAVRNGANGANASNGQRPQQRQPAQRRGPMTSGASEGRNAGRVGVKITPERKRAMIESGTVDANGAVLDAAKFRAQLKSYDQFDRANGLAR